MKNNLLVYILLCLLNLSWANARNKQQEAEAKENIYKIGRAHV